MAEERKKNQERAKEKLINWVRMRSLYDYIWAG